MLNQATIVGRITKKPVLRKTPDGNSVTTISLAVDRSYKVNGEKKTDFLDVVIWRKNAENVCTYTDKGSVVGVTGSLETRTYENQNGQKVKVVELIAEKVKFISSPKNNNSNGNDNRDNYSSNQNNDDDFYPGGSFDDDCPFN